MLIKQYINKLENPLNTEPSKIFNYFEYLSKPVEIIINIMLHIIHIFFTLLEKL